MIQPPNRKSLNHSAVACGDASSETSGSVVFNAYLTANTGYGDSTYNESQTAPVSFKIVLNTGTPNWTLEFFKNGVQQGSEYVYATNPGTLSQFGISLNGDDQVTSATFSNVSLTESQAVQAVPEPTTWAMMVLGFAGVGLLSYGRARRKGGLNLRLA